ncbi:CoA transferase [Bradyrhizobium sp. sBnM-33]|uniref:CoA transferase n=1 Tax=Bradyrhizobium sp. sBnM-33 TaxID=2831780 RepID=UPI0020BEF0EA|nr:CoA transferase [Bradyrhizobium sp. sBnM-33]
MGLRSHSPASRIQKAPTPEGRELELWHLFERELQGTSECGDPAKVRDLNRNKKSVTVNIAEPEGQEIICALVQNLICACPVRNTMPCRQH